ncbi:MAG: methyltransferase domain-containing protein [Rhizomicrobium sp.]
MTARSSIAGDRRSLYRDIRRYHAGEIALSSREIERRIFGTGAALAEDGLGETVQRLGLHKFGEDPPNYDVVRAALGLLPRPGMTLLDVGCGRGRVLLYAALLGAPRVTGIEILEARAALARMAASAHLPPGAATIRTGDALKLPWPAAEALIVMNPFFPSAYRHLRTRLLDYAAARQTVVISVSTLRDRLAADRRFRQIGAAEVGWIALGAFEVRH